MGGIHLDAPSADGDTAAEDEEFYSSWSLFLVCCLLILSLWTSYYLQIKRIRAVHETVVSIFAGMFVGLVVRMAPGSMIRDMLTFKHTLFFNLLLPPIILNSGYELRQENFFRNFGTILTFAFAGTFISAVGLGILVYVYSFLGLESVQFTLLECLIFGSTLSATDPVTILAIFQQYKVDPKLYSIIFGESLLNDAVSIVMYETLSTFHGEEITVYSLFHGLGIFLLNFSGSMALGVIFGLTMSLLLKHSSLSMYPSIETCLVALSAYTCYFFSNGITMSGIVSLLFCGITLKHYAYHTMSRRTQRASKYIFATLAQLSENFIFIYLGLSLFTSAPASERVTSYVKPLFITITTVCVIFVRYAAVFPLSEGINFFHRHIRGQRHEELPHSYQMMLFWAGLRGAVGVALAAGFHGTNAQTLRTTVLVVVVLTVVLFGGTTARMLEVLGIRTGVEEDGVESDEEEEGAPQRWFASSGSGARRWTRFRDEWSDHEPADRHGGVGGGVGAGAAQIGMHYAQHSATYNHHFSSSPGGGGVGMGPGANVFSSASSDYDDSDGEVLPLATAPHSPTAGRFDDPLRGPTLPSSSTPPIGGAEGDGKWFQAIDERYLIPLFSNATASRTFHARKSQSRRTSGLYSSSGLGVGGAGAVDSPRMGNGGGGSGSARQSRTASRAGSPEPSEPDLEAGYVGATFPPRRSPPTEESRAERGLASPMLRNTSEGDRGSQ